MNSVSPARTENDTFSNIGASLPGTVCARRSTVSAFAPLYADGDARAPLSNGVFVWADVDIVAPTSGTID